MHFILIASHSIDQAATWSELCDKLMPGGRFMVNCGAGEDAVPAEDVVSGENGSSMDGSWIPNATIRALCEAFPGQVRLLNYVPLMDFVKSCFWIDTIHYILPFEAVLNDKMKLIWLSSLSVRCIIPRVESKLLEIGLTYVDIRAIFVLIEYMR